MGNGRKPRGYWTFERCKEEASKYDIRSKFQDNSGSAYMVSLRNKWLDKICEHMTSPQKPCGYWGDKEVCGTEALKYESRNKFQKHSVSAYNAARKNGWLDEICEHMVIKGNRYKRCIYVYEFTDNSAYIGLTYDILNRHNRHMNSENSSVLIHMEKTNSQPIIKQLTDYIGIEEAVHKEEFYVNQYKSCGWNILNRIKTGATGSNNIKWSFNKCEKEALKYETKSEFVKKSYGAYRAALKYKWIDNVCSHMIEKQKPNGYWDFDKCKNEAVKYNTRTQFRKSSSGAYTASYRNNWLSIFFPV